VIVEINGQDPDDETREDIIRIMDMGVPLNDEWVTTLVTDGMEGLSFTNDIDFVAGAV